MARRALALVALALAAGSCSNDERGFVEPMRVTNEGQIVFQNTRLTTGSRGPGLGAEHLFFFDRTHGFVATTGGGGWQPKVGYQLPTEPGRIQRTDDGGRTWRTVWNHRDVVFESISFADHGTGLAVAALTDRKHDGSGLSGPPKRLLLLRTQDGGESWRALHPRPVFGNRYWDDWEGATLQPNHGFQLPSPTTWFAFGRETRRSRDGGKTWVKVPMPRGTTLARFVSANVGYAAATATGCEGQELWKTLDGARSWSRLPGTCGPSYMSLDFLDDRRGFTSAGPSEPYDDPHPPLVIRATTDGGSSWETRYVDKRPYKSRVGHWPSPTELHFVNDREGWAVSHEVSQGFAFDDLHVTLDGGRHWQRRWYPSPLPSAFASGGRAWAGNRRTTDGGRTWKLTLGPKPSNYERLVVATPERLVVSSWPETIESRDQGVHWRTIRPLSIRQEATANGRPAYLAGTRSPEPGSAAFLTREQRKLESPEGIGWAGAVAFTDSEHGLISFGSGEPDEAQLPAFTTRDGGRTWKGVRAPAGVPDDSDIAIAPGVVVIENGVPLRNGNIVLAVSTDSGGHWSTIEMGRPQEYDPWQCGAQRPTHASVWVACRRDSGRGRMVLLRSENDGKTWQKLRGTRLAESQLLAVGPDEAWAIGGNLWHTVDGGRSWTEVWPSLPPDSRAYGLWHYRPNVPNGFG